MLELFITGVDQNSDKIFVTAGLTALMQSLGYSSGVYKPVEVGVSVKDGFVQSPDLAFVKYVDSYVKTYFSYLLKENMPPLLAAAAEEISIEKNTIQADFQKIQNVNEVLIVEGVSGLGAPLNKNFLEEDMIKMFNIPLVLVAQNQTIDSILLSINHAKDLGIEVRGVILIDYSNDNINLKLMPKLIKEYTNVEILGTLPHFEKNINPNDLINEILNGINIEKVFNISIPKLSGS